MEINDQDSIQDPDFNSLVQEMNNPDNYYDQFKPYTE